jgi:UDPglucose 6-dehydrogenase
MNAIGSALRKKDGYHLVVLNSTVMPGSCDGEIRQALESASGRKVGENLGLVYSPEFIALGSVVKDMKFPDLVLIGQSDSKAGDLVEQVASTVIESKPEIHKMTLVNAEIVKIAINTFVTTKISFANMLSEICDHLPNADVDVVTNAVGSDSRVGKKYLKGALGYGGPCFPRDNIALTKLAMQLGAGFDVPEATDAINRRQINRIVNLVKAHKLENKAIAVLGMSYKPDTPVVEESQGVMIANLLCQIGSKVMVNDPMALSNARDSLEPGIEVVTKIDEVLSKSEVLIITTPWPEYKNLTSDQLRNKIVIDCWRIFEQEDLPYTKVIFPGRSSLLN